VQNSFINLPGMNDGSFTVVDLLKGEAVASVDTLKDEGSRSGTTWRDTDLASEPPLSAGRTAQSLGHWMVCATPLMTGSVQTSSPS